MLQRSLAACIALIWIQFACAEEITVLSFPDGETPSVISALLEEPQLLQNTINNPDNETCSQTPVPEDKEELLQQKLREAARLHGEILQLRAELGRNQQILVKVKMLEVSLTKLRKVDVEVSSLSDGKFDVTDVAGLQKVIGANGSSAPDKVASRPNHHGLNSFVDWLEQNRIAKVLAEPSVVVVSGRPAEVFVGNEIPVRGHDNSGTAVEYQKCGTELDVLALALNDNRVRLEIRARVSELDDAHSIRIENSSVPALRVRQCDTAIETKFGEPVVLNGMVRNQVETIKSESGVRDEVNEIALMVIVTPEPVEATTNAAKPRHAKVQK